MKAKQIKALLFIPIILLQSGCFFSASRERFAYEQLSKGIINGTIHKGMTSDGIIENFGEPSEKTSPTIYNNTKAQTFIYKLSDRNQRKMYYLYFKDDKLIDWKIF